MCIESTLNTVGMPASSAFVHIGTQLRKHACVLVGMLLVISWGVRCHLFSLFVCTIRKIKYFQGSEEKLNDQWSLSVPFFVTLRSIHLFVEVLLIGWTHVWWRQFTVLCVCLCVHTLWEVFKRVEKVLAWLLPALISSASLRLWWNGVCITKLST